eukprot:632269-Rhodomonas_salina.1
MQRKVRYAYPAGRAVLSLRVSWGSCPRIDFQESTVLTHWSGTSSPWTQSSSSSAVPLPEEEEEEEEEEEQAEEAEEEAE